jgi:hypothetical protein
VGGGEIKMDDRLESRYIVFKIKDLSELHLKMINDLFNSDAPTRDCVVVESHWPQYTKVVDLVLEEAGK